MTSHRFRLIVSEPWDFVSDHGAELAGLVESINSDWCLLALDSPIHHEGTRVDRLLATPRHGEQSFELTRENFAVMLTPVVGAGSPLEAAGRWRGWGLIGSLTIAPTNEP